MKIAILYNFSFPGYLFLFVRKPKSTTIIQMYKQKKTKGKAKSKTKTKILSACFCFSAGCGAAVAARLLVSGLHWALAIRSLLRIGLRVAHRDCAQRVGLLRPLPPDFELRGGSKDTLVASQIGPCFSLLFCSSRSTASTPVLIEV